MVTTDGEQDDMNSMIRYLAYADCFQTLGLIYTSSMWHSNTPAGAPLPAPNPVTGIPYGRWTGTDWIQHEIELYRQEYANFTRHDPAYPSPDSLLSVVRVGNIDGYDDMWEDTPGSLLIESLILDHQPGTRTPLYLQAWGGLNTIARALLDIQQSYEPIVTVWPALQKEISADVVIEASGTLQDAASEYIANAWPALRVVDGSNGYNVWGYPHANNDVPAAKQYYTGTWMKPHIVDAGELGAYEFTCGDGHTNGDAGYSLGGYPQGTGCTGKYSFVSEGDNVAYLGLIPNGINDPAHPDFGGWGGRQVRSSSQTVSGSTAPSATSTNTWVGVPYDTYSDGSRKPAYDYARWFASAQSNFAARLQWGVSPEYRFANHAPFVHVAGPAALTVRPGQTILLAGSANDPDHNRLRLIWWQYTDAGSYPRPIGISSPHATRTRIRILTDAKPGQTIHLILQATDNGAPSMTSYRRVVLTVSG